MGGVSTTAPILRRQRPIQDLLFQIANGSIVVNDQDRLHIVIPHFLLLNC